MVKSKLVFEGPVSSDVCAYLDRLQYEVDGLKVLNGHIATIPDAIPATVELHRQEFLNKRHEFEMAKMELLRSVAPQYVGRPDCRFEIIFADEIIRVYLDEEENNDPGAQEKQG